MSQFRNVSDDDRSVRYGIPGSREVSVPRDGVVTVADSADPSYECQPAVWAKVTTSPLPPPPAPQSDPALTPDQLLAEAHSLEAQAAAASAQTPPAQG